VLTFTLSNPNTATAFTGVAFTDTLPAGLTVPNDPGSSHCGGALTISSNVITFSGGTLAAWASCNFKVTVTSTTAGGTNNVTGNVSATNGGTGSTASANITVVAPPTIAKSFGAANIPLNGTTSLTFTMSNPNSTVALTGVNFSDSLPAGLTTPDDAGSSHCGGTLTISSNLITFNGGAVVAGGPPHPLRTGAGGEG